MKILARIEPKEVKHDNPQSLYDHVSGCEYYRQVLPLEHMRLKHGVDFDYHLWIDREDIGSYDVYFFIRGDIASTPEGLKHHINLDYAKSKGLPVVMDVDDYWVLPSSHDLYSRWINNGVKESVEGCIRKSDHVITTNERLADYVKKINTNVTVVPNALMHADAFTWSEVNKEPSEKVRIGWVGSRHHVADITQAYSLFSKFWKSPLKDKATIIFGGYNDEDAQLKSIATVMSGFGRTNALTCINAMPVNKYAEMYQHIDIALAPLANNAFNRSKSELKIIEAGWFGIPVVASDVYPYNKVIEHGYNGFLIRDNKDWFKYVRELVEDPIMRYDMGQNLKETVMQRFDLAKVNEARYNIFKSLKS